MSKIRILIVDDSAYSRQTLRKMLETDQAIEIVGISTDGIDAMAKTLRHKPDLITLDLEMPGMDGFSFLRWLMENRPTPVIIISSYSDSKTVFKALEFGAADFIAKPSRMVLSEFRAMEKELLTKVKGLKGLRMDRLSKNLGLFEENKSTHVLREKSAFDINAVAIGTSTGGPAALKILFSRLPADFAAGIVVSQHMPKGFTASFAERLNNISKIEVKEAVEGDSLEHGRALICPGGYHMTFTKKGKKVLATMKETRSIDKYTPSVDLMMSSLAEIYGPQTLGVILTGMGSDGRAGMLEIKKRGGYTIVEAEESAVVFGMPAEVIKAGVAERILPISDIPAEMVRLVKGTGRRKGS
ncbi:MAG: chemotaxis response regulator protein-glutamate methylesterase [Thermodesulfovibrionales bacterium]|nr:chemotaxis response regulator protein-glutamate methylesterase [Thermodesulfovibrionales bacterium]